MLEPKDYKISRLIAKQFVHGLSSGEEERLERWLAADPDNRRLYDRIMDSDNKAERDKYVEGLDIEKEWRALEQQLSPFKKKNRKLGWGIGIAASIALLVGVGLWFFPTTGRDRTACRIYRYSGRNIQGDFDYVRRRADRIAG